MRKHLSAFFDKRVTKVNRIRNSYLNMIYGRLAVEAQERRKLKGKYAELYHTLKSFELPCLIHKVRNLNITGSKLTHAKAAIQKSHKALNETLC
jgi:hypothetical protein